MALTDPKTTLAYHKSRAFTVPTDQSALALPLAMEMMEKRKNAHIHGQVSPETSALHFYYLNHMMALIQQAKGSQDELGDYLPIVERYYTTQTLAAVRMAYYLVCITTREARHWSGSNSKLAQTQCPVSVKFLSSKGGGGETGLLEKLKAKAPMTTFGAYMKAVAGVFYDGSWGPNPGYGGPNWGNVTDTLVSYVHGETSAEAMMDTAFTLAHNNGPIFNKGMVYTNYGNEFKKLLDIQAAGHIPGFMATPNAAPWFAKDSDLKESVKLGRNLFPDAHAGYVAPVSGYNAGKYKKPSSKPNPYKHQQPKEDHTYQVDAFKKVGKISEEKLTGALAEMVNASKKAGEEISNLSDALKSIAMDDIEDYADSEASGPVPVPTAALLKKPNPFKKPKIKFGAKGIK